MTFGRSVQNRLKPSTCHMHVTCRKYPHTMPLTHVKFEVNPVNIVDGSTFTRVEGLLVSKVPVPFFEIELLPVSFNHNDQTFFQPYLLESYLDT